MHTMGRSEFNNGGVCINEVLPDDGLRAILAKLDDVNEKNTYGLVCKRWLFLQSTERRRLCARAGPLLLHRLAARFTCVVDLDFSQSIPRSFYPGVSDKDLHIVATRFQCLRSLNLRECKVCINEVLPDDGLRAILAKLDDVNEKNNYGLVCKRWLFLQSTERRRLCARAGLLLLYRLATRFTCVVDLDFSQSGPRSFFPGVSDKDLQIVPTRFQ